MKFSEGLSVFCSLIIISGCQPKANSTADSTTTPQTGSGGTDQISNALSVESTASVVNQKNKTLFPVTGTCSDSAGTISLKAQSGNLLTQLTFQGSCLKGVWSGTVNLDSVSEGDFELKAYQGNLTSTQPLELTKASQVSITFPMNSVQAPGLVNKDNVKKFILGGACSQGVITIFVSNLTENSTTPISKDSDKKEIDCSAGLWSAAVDLTGIKDGELVVQGSITDSNENTGTTAKWSVSKDTQANIVYNAAKSNLGRIGQLNQNAFHIEGDCSANQADATVSLTFTDVNSLSVSYDYNPSRGVNNKIQCISNKWQVDKLDLSSLSDGPINLALTIKTSSSNQSTVTASDLYKSTGTLTAPSAVPKFSRTFAADSLFSTLAFAQSSLKLTDAGKTDVSNDLYYRILWSKDKGLLNSLTSTQVDQGTLPDGVKDAELNSNSSMSAWKQLWQEGTIGKQVITNFKTNVPSNKGNGEIYYVRIAVRDKGGNVSFYTTAATYSIPTAGGTDSARSTAKLFLDATLPTGSIPTDGDGTHCFTKTFAWKDLANIDNTPNAHDGFVNGPIYNSSTAQVLCNTEERGWRGTGAAADPYRISFNGILDLGSNASDHVRTNLVISPDNLPLVTLEAWAKPTRTYGAGQQQILSSDYGATWYRSMIVNVKDGTNPNGGIGAFLGIPANGNTTDVRAVKLFDVAPSKWVHIVLIYRPNPTDATQKTYQYKMFVNGRSSGDFKPTLSNQAYARPLSIGATYRGPGDNNNTFEGFQGSVAYVAVYDREITDEEVMDHCQENDERFGVTCNSSQ